MSRRRLLAAGAVLAAALGYLIYSGVTRSAVYFITPAELQAAPVAGKTYRLGGLVRPGSLRWQPTTLELAFTLTDGRAAIPVRHHGSPPDLFGENRGALVEGRWTSEGYFRATQILAKHSEDYQAPHDGSPAASKALLKTLSKDLR